MNFTEVVNEVQGLVKRPDKISMIRREVNNAINFCCVDSDFARDRQEQTIALDSTAYAQSILLSTLTRFRKVDCMRPADKKKFLSPIEPKHIFRPGGCEELDVYYIAGDQINLKLCSLASSLLLAYYSYPPILSGTDTFWLLEVSPYMIIDRAAAKVFAHIGDDASYRTHEASFRESYISACRDYKYGANPK